MIQFKPTILLVVIFTSVYLLLASSSSSSSSSSSWGVQSSILSYNNNLGSSESNQFLISPTSITDDAIPLTVTWYNIVNPTQHDMIVIYLVPNTYKQEIGTFPIPSSYPKLNTMGYYKVIDYDPNLTGNGQIKDVPIFYPRDSSFYFEYLRIIPVEQDDDNTNHLQQLGQEHLYNIDYNHILETKRRQQKQSLHTQTSDHYQQQDSNAVDHTYDIIAWSDLIQDGNKVLCTQFRLAFTHKANIFSLTYTTSDKQYLHNLHITENFDEINKDYYNNTNNISPSQSLSTNKPLSIQNSLLRKYSASTKMILKSNQLSSSPSSISSLQPITPDQSPFGSYSINDMVEFPANDTHHFINPGYFRTVEITLTKPSTKYYYRIRNSAGYAISKVFTVYSPQLTTTTTTGQKTTGQKTTGQTTTTKDDEYADLFVFGDAGVGLPYYTLTGQQFSAPLTYTSISQVIKQKQQQYGEDKYHTHVLNIGDLSYSKGYAFLNEYWMKMIEPIASSFPWMIALGNHETVVENNPSEQGTVAPYTVFTGDDSGGENGVVFYRRFKMPQSFQYYPYTPSSIYSNAQTRYHQDNSQRNIAYSYSTGLVHVIVVSSEHLFTKDSAQYNFVHADLINLNRTLSPFVILAMHRPLYCIGEECAITYNIPPSQQTSNNTDLLLRKTFTPLMKQYNVQLSIAGHVHHVSRSFPLDPIDEYAPIRKYKNKNGEEKDVVTVNHGVQYIRSVAPIHVVSGGGGNPFDSPIASYAKNTHETAPTNKKTHDILSWQAVRIMGVFGYHHIRAENRTHMTVTFYNNEYSTIHDQFVLVDPNF